MASFLHCQARSMTCSSVVILPLLLAVLMAACSIRAPEIRATGQRAANEAPFASRWWGYYQRGLTSAREDAHRKAIKDFRRAIDEKEHDQWQAEIPGETVIDYFPHREIGILHYQQREYSLAIPELEQSIQTAPSARGYFYLNQARAAKFRRDRSDDTPPEVVIEGRINKRILTQNRTHLITGVATDKSQLESVRVGDHPLPLEPAHRQRVFSIEVALREGHNDIPVLATDVFGNTTEQHLEIFCDRRGPLIEIMKWQEEQGQTIVSGTVSDAGGLRSMVVNDQPWKMSGTSTAYNFRFALLEEPLSITALDLAGNSTMAVITDDEPMEGSRQDQTVSMGDPSADNPSRRSIASEKELPFIQVIPPPREDIAPPLFIIKEDASFSETYSDEIVLKGEVDDASPIRSLSLNGAPFPIKNGRRIYFSSRQELFKGDNTFLFAAVDDQGKLAEKALSITRKTRNIDQLSSRMAVAVLPFAYQGDEPPLADLIQAGLSDSLRNLNRFVIIGPHDIEGTLPGEKSAPAHSADSGGFIHRSTDGPADTVLSGRISDTPEGLEIVARLLDRKTGTILAAHDTYTENKDPEALRPQLDRLAGRFKEDFPIVRGLLSRADEKEVIFNIGTKEGVQPNWLFLCYRRGLEIRHPVTGKLVDAEPEIVAELKVTEVSEHSARAVVIGKHGPLRKFDRVIAR